MKDTFGLVPPEIKAMVAAEEYNDRQAKAGRGISEALTALDPDLDLVFVRHDAAPDNLPPGAVPGRWHVRYKAAKPLPLFAAVTTPDGGYREPDSGILAEVANRDMHKRDVREKVFGTHERHKKQDKHAKDLETEQRRDEMVTDLKAGWRVAGTGGLRKRKWGAA